LLHPEGAHAPVARYFRVMPHEKETGTLAVSSLNGRPSASADAARRAQISRVKALSPRERMLLALRLGLLSSRLRKLEVKKP